MRHAVLLSGVVVGLGLGHRGVMQAMKRRPRRGTARKVRKMRTAPAVCPSFWDAE
ncbi:hypothetical protein GWL_20960 [Herbaspirillum sp. GW103]|nr:hypothetical protein GWL_20960 [Herbaspirillum sp. GW103]